MNVPPAPSEPPPLASAETDERMMRKALLLARRAEAAGDVPVGAVVACGERILGYGYNTRETSGLPTRHAELNAIEMAAGALGVWRLHGCTLYVTKEPCVMCAGALVLARLDRVVYGAPDPKAGCCRSLYELTSDPRFNHRLEVRDGVLAGECAEMISGFFRRKRRRPVPTEPGESARETFMSPEVPVPGEVAERPNALDSKSSKPA